MFHMVTTVTTIHYYLNLYHHSLSLNVSERTACIIFQCWEKIKIVLINWNTSYKIFSYRGFHLVTESMLDNKLCCGSFKWFQFNNFLIKIPKQLGTFQKVCGILNTPNHSLTNHILSWVNWWSSAKNKQHQNNPSWNI